MAPLPRTFSTDLPEGYRALLDTIAGSEAPSYDALYGTSRFSGYNDHPRQYAVIGSGPNRGRRTSAAGRYQFLARTWDDARGALGLPDFSPASQDRAAIYLAERRYRGQTGRELLPDIAAAGGDPARLQQVLSPLAGEWTSLPGGIEHNSMTNSAGRRFADNLAYYQGNPSALVPDAAAFSPKSMAEAGPGIVPNRGAAVPAAGGRGAAGDGSLPAAPSAPGSGPPQGDVGTLLASMLPVEPGRGKPAPRQRKLTVNAGGGANALFG